MLSLERVSSGYGRAEVLKGISMTVENREIVALLGANGAGKSTTLLTIAGMIKCRSGSITWKNQALDKSTPQTILKMGIVLCPEGRRIFPRLTVLENLMIGGFLRSHREEKTKLDRIYNIFPILFSRRQQLGGTLSGGEQQMLAIGRALMSEPQLLMLDEPSLGLAPLIVEQIFVIIKTINDEGVAILLVEQNASQALQIAHRGYVMATGHVLLQGRSSDILASDEVRGAYLGH